MSNVIDNANNALNNAQKDVEHFTKQVRRYESDLVHLKYLTNQTEKSIEYTREHLVKAQEVLTAAKSFNTRVKNTL